MDEVTLKQLKESNYYHPVITDVINDYKIMLEITIDGINTCEIGFNTVWDTEICKWASKYFVEGLSLVKQRVKEKGIKCRLLTQVNLENLEFLKSLTFLDIRHLEGLRGNFGIFDERGYMAFILNKEEDESLQTYFSNSKTLAEQQMQLFEELWNMAVPLSVRIKEISYEDKLASHKTITNYENIEREIDSFMVTCKKEFTIFSSNKILSLLLNKNNYLNYFPTLLKRDVTIRILTDNVDEFLIKQINIINNSSQTNSIQFRYTDKLDDLNEMALIVDNKYSLLIRHSHDNTLIATFSNEEHSVLVQELMFEKYWNEIQSLEVMNSTE